MADSEQPRGYQFGSFVLDLEWGGLLAADGREMPLRPKSFALLRMLVENAGRILSHEVVMTALWPDLFVTENNVNQCIRDIRRALGSEASRTLRTLPRRGYRFTSDVIPVPWRDPRGPTSGIREPDGNQDLPEDASPSTSKDQSASFTSNANDGSTGHQRFSIPETPPRNHDPQGKSTVRENTQIDLAQKLISPAFDHPEATRGTDCSSRRPDNGHGADMNSMLQGSIRRIIDELGSDTYLANLEADIAQRSEPPDIDLTAVDERVQFAHRMAWALLMKIIEDVNRHMDLFASRH